MRGFRCINFIDFWIISAMMNSLMSLEVLSFPASATPRRAIRESFLRASDHDTGGNSNDSPPSSHSNISRRTALGKVAWVIPSSATAGFFFSFPQSASADLAPYTDAKQTVVITGCNSGIGLDAATRLARRGHRVFLACRTLGKAQSSASDIKKSLGTEAVDLIPAECDLASLESIASFAKGIKNVLGDDGKLDVLALNAGVARNTAAEDVLRTKEGFELTVGTNHLGHFYLASLLLPMIKKDSGRIVVTASGVHDPESPGGAQGSKATLGDLAGLEQGPYFDMVDGGDFDADKAYKDSKLCNVLFTRELQRRLVSEGCEIKVNCFNPGLIVGTGLFRDQNPVFTKVFDIAATNILKVGENTHWGGGALEYMCLDKQVGLTGGQYYSSAPGSSKYGEAAFGEQFHVTEVSKEARDDEKAKMLWKLSARLVGISS